MAPVCLSLFRKCVWANAIGCPYDDSDVEFDCNYKHVWNVIIESTRIYARLSIFESEIYQNEPNMYNTCTCAHASIQQMLFAFVLGSVMGSKSCSISSVCVCVCVCAHSIWSVCVCV